MVVAAYTEIALTDLSVLLADEGQGSELSVWLEMKRGHRKEDAAEEGAANLYTNSSQIHS